MLSIDIGLKNLGYAIYVDGTLLFDILSVDKQVDKSKPLTVARALVLREFISGLFQKYDIKKVIIEKQVNLNTAAMEMMYLLTGIICTYTEDIMIYDPKRKFITLCLNYDTHNKHHKALSVKIIGNYLAKEYPDLVDRFNSFKKKDDISDAMLMLFTVLYRAEKNKLKTIQTCGL